MPRVSDESERYEFSYNGVSCVMFYDEHYPLFYVDDEYVSVTYLRDDPQEYRGANAEWWKLAVKDYIEDHLVLDE